MRSPPTGLALVALAALAAALSPPAAAQPIPLLPPGPFNSPIAAALPAPPVAFDGAPHIFLLVARSAVESGRTGEAREALERAETRLLGQPPPSPVIAPDGQAGIWAIRSARQSLATRDRPATLRAIDEALSATSAVAQGPPKNPAASVESAVFASPGPQASVVVAAPPAPSVTRALLAGHWALDGANWRWVPPETVLRRVETAGLVPGRYVWRDRRYVWVRKRYEQ